MSVITRKHRLASNCQNYGLMNTKVRNVLLVILFMLLVVENILQTRINYFFAYIDETAAIALFVWAVFLRISKKGNTLRKADIKAIVLLSIVCLIGITGNLINEVQPSSQAIVIDCFTCIKFFVAYWASTVIVSPSDSTELIAMLRSIVVAIVTVLFVCMVANQLLNIGMSESYRFGVAAFQFLYGHPSTFAAILVGLSAILLTNVHENKVYIYLLIIIIASTMRFKAIGFALILVLMITFFKKSKKISISFLLMGGCAALIVAADQISTYFATEGTARSVLFLKSIEVANMFFPIGSGFGSYGSYVTLANYVPLYYELGFGSVYGLTQSNPVYLADMFWPTIIAQFGYIGLVAFVSSLVFFFISVAERRKSHNAVLWAAVCIPLYLFISSTSETAFFSSGAVYLAFVMAIVTAKNDNVLGGN